MKLDELDDDGEGPLDDDEATESQTYEAEEFLQYLEDLIGEDHVQYARETLEGIYETVRKRGRVSEAQRRAVENIDEGGQRGRGRWWK